MVKSLLPLTIFLLAIAEIATAGSLDIPVSGYGLSLGNSSRFTGIRLNAIDQDVERITGLNLTVWNPGQNPNAEYNGVTLGLIGTKAARIRGVALSGIGVNAREQIVGIAGGVLGVGANQVTGLAGGLIMIDVRERLRGIVIGGFWTGQCQQLDGVAVSLGSAFAKNIRGAAIGGLGAAAEESFTGLSVGLGGFYADRFRGLALGGVGGGGGDLRGLVASGIFLAAQDVNGVACTLGGIGGQTLDGIFLGGLGLGSSERIRGVAISSLLTFSPEVTGVAIGALNGLYVDRIDLEDFLHFRLANQRFTGLSIGIVNYTAHLRGVQLGLINYAGNNPRWLRLLPLANVHL